MRWILDRSSFRPRPFRPDAGQAQRPAQGTADDEGDHDERPYAGAFQIVPVDARLPGQLPQPGDMQIFKGADLPKI